ncbi:MAG: Gfo/Idh/MocA family oxidoreductase [Deltaproteobacteria bacterium]|nr:Gfo/Idh/MocA family oxidoreductase [Deltaproteobacteria bacterium]
MRPLRIGLTGSGFIAQVHYDAVKAISRAENVEVAALYARNAKKGKEFCKRNAVPEYFDDYDRMLRYANLDLVAIGVPNYLHAKMTMAALRKGLHVMCEKPLAITLKDADKMIDTAKKQGVLIGYAEELCYVPKFRRMKELADQGAIGDVYYVKQCEKHGGPYSDWFFEPKLAGGGILMDMGCHSLEFCRWFFDKPRVSSVYAHMGTYRHIDRPPVEDHVVVHLEFGNGKTALVESSWALQGGMDSIAEAYGVNGVVYADLLRGSGLRCFSEKGYIDYGGFGDKVNGWHFPGYEWSFENGYPQEFQDLVHCIRNGGTPVETAQDGRDVLEIMLAAYWSAATGKKIELPFDPPGVKVPVDLWLRPGRYAKKMEAN